jgi:hypothetical protein
MTVLCPNPSNCTAWVQSALDTDNVGRIVIPAAAAPWQVGPLIIRKGNRTLVLEPGAELLAIEGGFHGDSDCLLTIEASVSSLIVDARGATIRMRKLDYLPPRYTKAEWRMLLSIRGATGVTILGGKWVDAGGDGIYITSGEGSAVSHDVLLNGVVVTGAWRNGLSVISATNLRVVDSQFSETNGTNPQCGVDLEPNSPENRLQGIFFGNVTLTGNRRCGFSMGLYALVQSSAQFDVTVEHMRITDTPGTTADAGLPPGHPGLTDHAGIGIVLADSYNLSGTVAFTDVTVTDAFGEALFVSNWPSGAVNTAFSNLSITNVSFGGSAVTPVGFGPVPPIVILPTGGTGKDEDPTLPAGGIRFESTTIYDHARRPWLSCLWDGNHGHPTPPSLANVSGDVTVFNPLAAAGCPANFGKTPTGISVRVVCNP